MKPKIQIILADDQNMFLDGLKSILSAYKNYEILGTANNGFEVLNLLEKSKPNLLLLDINMPEMDGIDACRVIKNKYPDLKILILSSYSNKEFIADVMHNGADGYILKNAGTDELMLAINTIVEGKRFVSPELRVRTEELFSQLSKRELYILRLIGRGMTAPQIAQELFLSPHTIETHRKNILHKLNFKNQSLLVKYAVERGLT